MTDDLPARVRELESLSAVYERLAEERLQSLGRQHTEMEALRQRLANDFDALQRENQEYKDAQAKGRQYYDGDVNLPAFLTAKNLKRFISKDLEVTSSQIEFRSLRGQLAGFFLLCFRGTSVPPMAVSTTERARARGSVGFFFGFLGMPHHARNATVLPLVLEPNFTSAECRPCVEQVNDIMLTRLVHALTNTFEAHAQQTETGVEYWLARDIQFLLGYAKWDNFLNVVSKARTSCETSGHKIADHFADVGKMVTLGSGSQREVNGRLLVKHHDGH